MDFQVGDRVIHRTYGPSKIVKLEEKVFSGRQMLYYVLLIDTMTVWVPQDSTANGSLRAPTPVSQFEGMFAILSGPGEPLSSDRLERRTLLLERMKDGSLESKCRVVRDLQAYRNFKKLNESDTQILEQARKLLISEWGLSLAVPLSQAEDELNQMLEISRQHTPPPGD